MTLGFDIGEPSEPSRVSTKPKLIKAAVSLAGAPRVA